MLLELRIANFRSIAHEQTFSMLPVGRSGRAFKTGATHEPYALLAAGIFGPNGAGKSNVIKALSYIRYISLGTAQLTDVGEVPLEPFLFDPHLPDENTSAEIKFSTNGVLWRYGFSVGKKGFSEEYLYRRMPRSPETVAFERKGTDIVFGKWVRGEKEAWRRDVLPSQALLSKLRYSASNPFRKASDWLAYYLRPLPSLEAFMGDFTASQCKSEESKSSIVEVLSAFDIKIDDIFVDVVEIPGLLIEKDTINRDVFEKIKASDKDLLSRNDGKYLKYEVMFHRGGKKYELPFAEESTGTRYLFKLAGPLLDILSNGYTLVVDEIDSALHSDVLRTLIEIFHSPLTNPRGAQLVFTAHDLSVLNDGVLEKDQIWLVEKDERYTSTLTSLADFVDDSGEPLRRSAQFARQYLSGRFGAKPAIELSRLKLLVARVMESVEEDDR